jgi:hypothetical protein
VLGALRDHLRAVFLFARHVVTALHHLAQKPLSISFRGCFRVHRIAIFLAILDQQAQPLSALTRIIGGRSWTETYLAARVSGLRTSGRHINRKRSIFYENSQRAKRRGLENGWRGARDAGRHSAYLPASWNGLRRSSPRDVGLTVLRWRQAALALNKRLGRLSWRPPHHPDDRAGLQHPALAELGHALIENRPPDIPLACMAIFAAARYFVV